MKKWIFLVTIAIIAFASSSAVLADQSSKAVSMAKADWIVYEAMWVAGGPEYQAAVVRLAGEYAAKMNKRCKASIDVTAAAKVSGVATPHGSEATRDYFIKKQIAIRACIDKYGERYTARLGLM